MSAGGIAAVTGSAVLLVRHGSAEDGHPMGDQARALSVEGRQEFRVHARRLAARIQLRGVMTSPLVRAVQTAEILAEAMNLDDVTVARELGTTASADELAAFVARVGVGSAFVGHNPTIAETAALLTGLRGMPQFRKGAAAALASPSARGGPWRLLWIASPGGDFEEPSTA